MYKRSTTIANPTGLHARPASDFIQATKEFQSKIMIKRPEDSDDDACNAKSIVSLLALALDQGEQVEIYAEGEDEQQAVDTLIALIDSRFGE